MEEDIKILKEKIERWQPYKNTRFTDLHYEVDKEVRAVENVLARLEQDERVIEKMASYLVWEYEEYNEIEEVIDHFRKKCEQYE